MSTHPIALERQVMELLSIMYRLRRKEECLNNKTDMGGSKIPSMEVSSMRGIGMVRVTGDQDLP